MYYSTECRLQYMGDWTSGERNISQQGQQEKRTQQNKPTKQESEVSISYDTEEQNVTANETM